MLDTTLKTYATRHLGCLALGGALALGLALVSGGQARAPGFAGSASSHFSAGALHAGRPLITGAARVLDGDTIAIGETRIRLEGIDAPESGQTCVTRMGQIWHCGVEASHTLARLIGRNPVACADLGLDKYGRTLASCSAGGVDLNAEMVRRGYAWAFVRYSTAYVALEAEARRSRAGIWEGDAQPAWDFRAGRWGTAASTAPQGCAIKGNVTSSGRIYHVPWSPWYDKVKMDGSRGKRWFCSEAEAVAAGWRPAHSF